MERIPVNAPDSTYNIVFATGMVQRFADAATEFDLHRHVVVISDENVGKLYGEAFVKQLPNASLLTMPVGEAHKNLDTVRTLYDGLIEAKADRGTTIVALGGGVVGDTAGFVAATYMRGVRFVQIPTSLLAMVDSSVGGKVGVDIPQGKNLIGAFKQPDLVLIDTDMLQTLPVTEWRAGMAEVIKHGLIADPLLLDPELQAPHRAMELVKRAVQVKVNIVEEDPYEHSVRAYLNLGHTFGHAIEQVTGYAWLHGYAVAAGLVAAAKASQKLGMINAELVANVEQALLAVELPTRIGNLDPETLYAAMATDKKWQGGESRFVLLDGLAKPRVVKGVPKQTVIDVLEEMCADE